MIRYSPSIGAHVRVLSKTSSGRYLCEAVEPSLWAEEEEFFILEPSDLRYPFPLGALLFAAIITLAALAMLFGGQ